MALLLALGLPHARAAATSGAAAPAASPGSSSGAGSPAASTAPLPEFYIREYRVTGAHHLQPIEIEAAVYPFLGPGRTAQDVEGARAALEKAYQDKNYTSVEVNVPPQSGAGGIVFIQVNELTVGRLRVHGSRYFDINHIKEQVPSLAEGNLVNFTQAQHDLVGLNQLPDRRVTPVIQAGVAPGTMDVDLNVKDTLPLHGSIELNNRYSQDTPSLRLNGSVSYNNLWQLGQSAGGSVQISPQNVSKAQVYTGFYTIPIPNVDTLSFTLEGTKQNSNVSTLGALGVVGKGAIGTLNTNIRLPTMGDYFQNFTFGISYKHITQITNATSGTPDADVPLFPRTPTTYLPLTFDYNGTVVGKGFLTDLDVQLVMNIRGIGSNAVQFDNNRFGAQLNFFYLRGDISQTQDLPHDFQLFGKLAGQVADSPLINSEQFPLGGLDTVRGYLESEVLGDDAIVGNLEFRLPSLLGLIKTKLESKPGDDWRVYAFFDAASASDMDTLPEQTERFSLASYGGGTRITLFNHFNGSFDLAVPLFSQMITKAQHPFVTFRIWTDF
jgi:hemolysin activation/secretion protein